MSMEEMQDYRELILENIEYDHLCREFETYREDLDEIVELIVETVCARRKTTRIAGADFPHEVVRSRFLKLDSSHIEFVMESLHNNTTEVRNMKQSFEVIAGFSPTSHRTCDFHRIRRSIDCFHKTNPKEEPMSDNRKYYYLKLKENYFDDDSIVLLESMQDGVLYSNILLKLYLKSLKHGGRLQLDENIPYTAQMIATITRQQIGTVERALQIFLKLGLVEVLDSGTFYMSNIELLIGQSSTEAERKRAARLQNKALSAPRTNGGHLSDIRPPEIEIELLFFMLALPAPAAVAAALAGMGLRLRAGGRVCRFRLQQGKGQADIQVDGDG